MVAWNNTEILVYTGQHFDRNMSELFFEELDIPNPDYNLGISGGTHAQMTGCMMMAIEEVLQKNHRIGRLYTAIRIPLLLPHWPRQSCIYLVVM